MSNRIKSGKYYEMAFKESETTYTQKSAIDQDLIQRLNEIQIEDSPYILDVGCGIGKVSAVISQVYPNAKIIGFDISENNVRKAKAMTPNAFFLKSQEINIPFRNNSFDLAVARMSFHHFPEPIKHLYEMKNVLKMGGQYLVIDILPSGGFENQLLNQIFYDADAIGVGDGHSKFYTKLEYENMAQAIDYKIDFQPIFNYKVCWDKKNAFHSAIYEAILKSPLKFKKLLEFSVKEECFSYTMKMSGIIFKKFSLRYSRSYSHENK